MKTTKEQALELKETFVIAKGVTGKIVGYSSSYLILCINLRIPYDKYGWSSRYLTENDKLIVPLSKLENRRLFYVFYKDIITKNNENK